MPDDVGDEEGELKAHTNSSSSLSSDYYNDDDDNDGRIYLVSDGTKSSDTKRNYLSAFNSFLKTSAGTSDLRTLLNYKPSVIESKIIRHMEHLKGRNLSYSAIHGSYSAIIHFFENNDINLNTRKIKRFFPEDESDRYSSERPYSLKEIEQILLQCDRRSRVMVLLMASTGMRIGGLRDLRLGDLRKIDEFRLYLIWVYSYSKKHRYYTFCTPECASAIDAYLDYRRKFGEEIKDKSPLIREQFNIDNPFTANAPRSLSKRMLTHIFDDLLKRSGINQVKLGQKRRDVMTSHGFRKFFITECDRANIRSTIRYYLSGHKLPKQDENYIKSRGEEEVLAEYVKVIDRLTVNQEHRFKKRIQDLETTQAEQITELKERLNSTEESLNKIRKIADKYTNLLDTSSKGYTKLVSNLRTRLQKEGKWTDALEIEFWGVPND